MRILRYADFRSHLKENLDAVNDDKELLIVSRTKGKSVLVMDIEVNTIPAGSIIQCLFSGSSSILSQVSTPFDCRYQITRYISQ
ncbi:Antitoxin Phd_YefM, type II toxin-antitoxin system [Chitinophaga jiangningensis]|uniref:Antitoxin Phd_YefM, type II toxin-antitoxin system n=1 Tax=Chitinophaga jiangningensis TaxID=1419482 RepID=A0A1M6YIY5_9BACT|nr:Antitoxin Phd_YefM, type II toxin-antitoxin system [Chitinophaga jiangningensis]